MKKMLKIISAVAAAAMIGVVASTSVQAGDSFAFSFGYGGGGYGHRGWHHGPRYGVNFGYSYCAPPAYYYYAPPPPPPPVVYYRPAPVYYYSGGSFYSR